MVMLGAIEQVKTSSIPSLANEKQSRAEGSNLRSRALTESKPEPMP